MLRPTDPAPIPHRAGLGPAECGTCGATTLAAVGIDRPRCDPCRRDAIALTTAEDMLAILASRAGQLGLSHRAAVERHVHHNAPAVVPVKVKIIERARRLAADSPHVPASARRLARDAEAFGRRAVLTYALAEDMTKDELVHSLCVRLWTDLGAKFGYASYINGKASSAVLWRAEEGGPRKCNITEFSTLALGKPYTPPVPAVVGPCPSCFRPVRWTKGGTFRHRLPDDKNTICPGLQFS